MEVFARVGSILAQVDATPDSGFPGADLVQNALNGSVALRPIDGRGGAADDGGVTFSSAVPGSAFAVSGSLRMSSCRPSAGISGTAYPTATSKNCSPNAASKLTT